MKSLALFILKPLIAKWLTERALVLPKSKKEEYAARTGLPVEVFTDYERQIQIWALAQIDTIIK